MFTISEHYCDDCKLNKSCESKELLQNMIHLILNVDETTRNRILKRLEIGIYCKDREVWYEKRCGF